MHTYKNVDEYIQKAVPAHKSVLSEMRKLVLGTVPDAVEGISYGMPAYTWRGAPLCYFAAMKGHFGVYPTSGPIESCKALLDGFSYSKGCVRIPYGLGLPTKLVVKLLTVRMREIRDTQKQTTKKAKK